MVRVHELATELEIPSSKVLEVLKALGADARSHMSSVSESEAEKVRAAFKSKKVIRSKDFSGKRDFRVKDISRPSKSPSVRPRPELQQSKSGQRVVTRKVIKRVIRRAPSDDTAEKKPGPAPKPEVPDIDKVLRETGTKSSLEVQEKKAEGSTATGDRVIERRGGEVKEKRKDREDKAASGRRKDKRQKKGKGKGRQDDRRGAPSAAEDKTSRTGRDRQYEPVGKTRGRVEEKRPPRPKIPKIPTPQDYLKPSDQQLQKSMAKLVQKGMRSEIDSGIGRGKGGGGESKSGKQKKRRRKIISNKQRKTMPQGGRGRNIHKQVQSQLDTSTTFKKRGRGRGRRGKSEDRTVPKGPPKKIRLGEHVSIKDLSAQTGLKSSEIISFLMKELEILATINQTVDQEIAALICDHFGFECEMKKVVEVEDVLKTHDDKPEDLKPRPPVVTVLGHVDHGKTKLLDAIRGTDVVATEAGGITQKIGAFSVEHETRGNDIRPITFIDTPGHAAFTAMRARGAQVTDIAVLVVAANDGVMPQTIEAINHARSAGVEIVVAINKIDLPEANPELVKQQLSEHGLVPEDWGGQIIMVPISAKQKMNLEDLLENVLTVADILELKANPTAMVEGAIIEARLDKGRGALATILVKRGTLNVGDYVVAGRTWGRIRQMTDEDGNNMEEAGPSIPVLISGLDNVPQGGDILNQVADEKTAREICEKRVMDYRQGRLQMVNTISLEDFYEQLKKGETKELNIILKGDLQGSIEALIDQLGQLSTDEVAVKIIHSAVGNITDSDIMLAMASQAIILGFNVVASPEIRKHAANQGVDIRTYNIIYKAVEDIQAALEGLLEPEYEEKVTGVAEVRQIFKRTGKLVVAGLFVEEGKLVRGNEVRIIRDEEEIAKLQLNSLKRFKDDVKEVENGFECGVMFDGFNDLREGDRLVAFEVVKVLRTLTDTRAG